MGYYYKSDGEKDVVEVYKGVHIVKSYRTTPCSEEHKGIAPEAIFIGFNGDGEPHSCGIGYTIKELKGIIDLLEKYSLL